MKKINHALLIDDDSVANFLHYRIIKSLGITEKITILNNGSEALNYILEESKGNGLCPECKQQMIR